MKAGLRSKEEIIWIRTSLWGDADNQLGSVITWDDPICKSVGPRWLDPSSFPPSCFFLLILSYSCKFSFSITWASQPFWVGFSSLFSPLASGNNKILQCCSEKGKSAGRTQTPVIQQQSLCKENMEPGSVSPPSPSSKWHQLLLFTKPVNEFPLLMGSGLPATSCSLEKEVTLLCCSEKQGTWPYPACSRVNLNCSLSAVYKPCSCLPCWPKYCKMFGLQTYQGKIGFALALHFPFSSQFSISNILTQTMETCFSQNIF